MFAVICSPSLWFAWKVLTIEHIEFCLHQLSASRLNLQSSLALLLTFYPTINRSTVERMLWPFVGFSDIALHLSRERLRRVLRKKAAVILHLHTLTSADLHLHTSHLLIYIFTPSHLLIYIFTPSHHTFTPADLHLHTLTSADLHLHTFTPADLHLHTLTPAV